jgi:ATP-dependent Zn protease
VKINAKSNVKKRIIVSTALSTGILFLFLALFWYIWKKKQQKKGKSLRS